MKCLWSSIILILVVRSCFANFLVPGFVNHSNRIPETSMEESKCTTNQTELNIDCIFNVVDEMNLENLLTMAETSHFYSNMCAKSFRHRFSKHEIIIENHSVLKLSKYMHSGMKMLKTIKNRISSDEPARKPKIETTTKYIRIKSVHDALKTLRTFGHVIQKIKLKLANADTIESIAILRYVNKYCSNSTTEITMDIGRANALQHFLEPFKKVERITFSNKIPSAKRQPIPINQLFPSLRWLMLRIQDSKDVTDDDYFTAHFPYLEHVVFGGSLYLETPPVECGGSTLANGLLEKNPQIRNIELVKFDPKFLQKEISSMPQLEHLYFHDFITPTTTIRFENVTNLAVNKHHYCFDPRNLIFPKLQELDMGFFRFNHNASLAFLSNHFNLKRLHFCVGDIIDTQFAELTSNLQNLEEISIRRLDKRASSVGVYQIIEFIRRHEKLMKLHLDGCSEADEKLLRSKFIHTWKITECGEGLSLVRNPPPRINRNI